MAGDAKRLEHLAATLGMYGASPGQRRKLQRTGNSITVSLDPAWVRDVLRGGPGAYVRVAREGDRVIITPDAEA